MIRLPGNCHRWLLAFACVTWGTSAGAQAIVDDAFLFGTTYKPSAKSFDIATAGTYQMRLVDLGFPQALLGVSGAVVHGNSKVATLAAPGVVEFQALAGRHKLLIAPVPRGAGEFGTFGASVVPAAGGASLVEHSDSAESIVAVEPPLQSSRQASFAITAPGRYRVSLADLGFPAALVQLQLLLTRADGTTIARVDGPTGTAEFDAIAGGYSVLVFADASNAAAAGLYSVTIAGLAGQGTPFAVTQAAGRLVAGREVMLPVAGAYSMALSDLQIPRSLDALGAVLTQGGSIAARTDVPGTVSFIAVAGQASLFVRQVPGGGLQTGVSYVEITTGAAEVFESVDVATADTATGGESAFMIKAAVAAAGTHRASLVDFEFPAAATQAALYLVQDGRVLGERTGAGSLDVQAVAEELQGIVVVTPNAQAGSGLLSLRIAQQPAGTLLVEETRAVGINLQSRALEIAAAGSYDLTVTDLAFPAQFAELALAVTRGDERVAAVFGSGKVSFTATPGTYLVNVLGRVGTASPFGAFGLKVEPTPAPPAITFSGTPLEVKRDGTVALAWSSTGATSCLASDGWSGSRPTSGTATSAPLSVDTRFTLTCTGPGGQASARVDAQVKAAASGGGGGVDAVLLVLIGGLLGAGATRRRQRSAAGIAPATTVGSSR